MNYKIIKETKGTKFDGCDFVLSLPKERAGKKIRLLQLTDMQVIDATQRRTPERLRPDEIEAWMPENFDTQFANHARSLVAQSRPDLIFITGDMVYGSFDDSGRVFEWFCNFMDSFGIPWAPVFGNHDNESKMGVAWQCEKFENSRFCLFKRGEVSGNGNYTVGIAVEDEIVRVIHLLDSNGCADCSDPEVIKERNIFKDQWDLVFEHGARINAAQNKMVPSFIAFHIPIDPFKEAECAKGYCAKANNYVIGVDFEAKDDDFGFAKEKYSTIKTEQGFAKHLNSQGIDGVFVGHVHNNCSVIRYEGIRWVFGLKTGQYDYHIPGQLGATEITLEGDDFSVKHIPSLVVYAPMPGRCPIFDNMFAYGEDFANK